MQTLLTDTINIIARTLLRVGERVICISENEVIINTWDNEACSLKTSVYTPGTKISEIINDPLISTCAELAKAALKTGKDSKGSFITTENNIPAAYNILAIAPDNLENSVFIVLTKENEHTHLTEEKWKTALDLNSDGVWEMNFETNKILFSDKWHHSFGKSFGKITTVDEWTSHLHPEDTTALKTLANDFLAGVATHYSCELRCQCGDGQYKWILSKGLVVQCDENGKPIKAIGTHTDIDERKQNEQKHISTLVLLSNLIDNIHDGIIVIDNTAKVIFANQAYCDVFELSVPPAALKGMPVEESIAQRKQKVKYPDLFEKRVIEIRSAGKIVQNDEIKMLNGKIYSRDYIPFMISDTAKGEIWKFRDITEEKLSSKRFKEQRLFYERILNSIPEDIAVHDAKHRFLYLNPSAIKDDELRKWMIGKNHEDYFAYRNLPLDLAKARNERFDIVIKSKKPYEWEERIVNRQGAVSYHYRCLFPLFDNNGEIDLVIVFGANITPRVLAEIELKKSRDTFASAFEYSGIGMALLDLDGKWTEVNKALCLITGYSREELLTLTFQEITYPADLPLDMEIMGNLLQGKAPNYIFEKRYISKNKKIIWVLLTVSIVRNEANSPDFFIAQVVDITAKKEMVDEINRKNAELEATKISLINKISQMDELTHIVAHNLRGPAGNIKMLSERDENEEVAFSKEEALDLIHQSSLALIESLNTLMETTQIQLNKNIAYDDCDLTEIINNIINQMHGIIYEKHVSIELKLDVKELKYPKVYLESIVYNLISNAIKYSATDRVPEISIVTYHLDNKIYLSVKDNGLGIDMNKYQHKIFKLNQVFHRGYDSKGVGLFITKTQVESLGGSIDVKSELNKGSEFIVRF